MLVKFVQIPLLGNVYSDIFRRVTGCCSASRYYFHRTIYFWIVFDVKYTHITMYIPTSIAMKTERKKLYSKRRKLLKYVYTAIILPQQNRTRRDEKNYGENHVVVVVVVAV